MIKPLKSEKKIEKIFEKGTHIKEGSVLIKFYDFDDGEVSFGVSVPKKNFKSAVTRNRVKRQLREIVRNSRDLKQIKKGVSFFVIYNGKVAPNFYYLKKVVCASIKKI